MRSRTMLFVLSRKQKACAVVFLAAITAGIGRASTCTGTCGTDVADGDVTLPPGFTSYSFVTTTGGPSGGGTLPSIFGSPGVDSTNGSTYTTSAFSATAGELISFDFNYVTSDGSGFPDYAWAALVSTTGGTDYLIFTAQTQPTGNTVPGFTMPPLAAGTSLVPPTSPITPGSGTICGSTCNPTPGGPVWSELGTWSGQCWAVGCGLTGWIESQFTGEAAGSYVLEFGVSNANDEDYDSGLAFAGVEVGGMPVSTTPEPSTFGFLAAGIGALVLAARLRRRRTA
jgi:MYXO-CTERM domain-containing protein